MSPASAIDENCNTPGSPRLAWWLGSLIVGLSVSGLSAAHYWHPGWWHNQLRIQQVNDLRFGTIAPDPHAHGIVRVRANRNGFSQCSRNLTCLDGGSRAEFRVSGNHWRYVHIYLPRQATLRNGQGNTMTVDRFRMNAPGFIRGRGKLQRNGSVMLGVGADLHVGANQPTGRYTGTFQVTLCYE